LTSVPTHTVQYTGGSVRRSSRISARTRPAY
jgi:hypothetical protein